VGVRSRAALRGQDAEGVVGGAGNVRVGVPGVLVNPTTIGDNDVACLRRSPSVTSFVGA
jgi:hypothetical protein